MVEYKGYHKKGEIEIIGTQKVFQNQYMTVLNDDVIFPSGYQGTYLRLQQPNKYSVAVLPITSEGEILLIKNFRHGMRGWCYEIPKGGAEDNETGARAAERELYEETGYVCERIEEFGEYSESPAVLSGAIKCFVAFGCKKQSKEHSEKTEAIDGVKKIEIREFFEPQNQLDFRDALTELMILKYLHR